MPLLKIGMIACWALCAAGLAAYAASVVRELMYVTLADGRRVRRNQLSPNASSQQLSLADGRRVRHNLPLMIRLLQPFVPSLRRFTSGKQFAAARASADQMIISGGFEGMLSGVDFVALKFLSPIVYGTLWTVLVFLLSGFLPSDSFLAENSILLSLFGVFFFYAYPLMWLRGVVKRRHISIMRTLPFVLDLLTLSVEAGMDFMSALQRNCERRKLDPLNEELTRMMSEIQVGTPRRVALMNMAERVRQPDLKSVAHALVQADELGVSIGSILRIQSDQLRSRRFDRAEKMANEAPVKMLGPLMLCIFPAVFVILLGPIISQATKSIF